MRKTYETMVKVQGVYTIAYTIATNSVDATKQFKKHYARIGLVKESK